MLLLHDESFSKEDVVVNTDHFQEFGFAAGSVAQIMSFRHRTAVRDFQNAGHQRDSVRVTDVERKVSKRTTRPSDKRGSREGDPHEAYVCVVKEATAEQKKTQPRLEVCIIFSRVLLVLHADIRKISLSATVAKMFGFRNRMQVMVSAVRISTAE